MKLYLSSIKFGDEVEKLRAMMPQGSKIGHINNARDWTTADPQLRNHHQQQEIETLNTLGFKAEVLNLQDYFHRPSALRGKLADLDGVWVSGGNTFVLLQAMVLSGFDQIFEELKVRKGFLYVGYSAGVCALCDSLKYIQQVDDPTDFPYPDNKETIWEGLNYFNYGIISHYRSDHSESEMVELEVENCIRNKWLFKALSDGEVIIIDEE